MGSRRTKTLDHFNIFIGWKSRRNIFKPAKLYSQLVLVWSLKNAYLPHFMNCVATCKSYHLDVHVSVIRNPRGETSHKCVLGNKDFGNANFILYFCFVGQHYVSLREFSGGDKLPVYIEEQDFRKVPFYKVQTRAMFNIQCTCCWFQWNFKFCKIPLYSFLVGVLHLESACWVYVALWQKGTYPFKHHQPSLSWVRSLIREGTLYHFACFFIKFMNGPPLVL